jgi:hypothetical protein
MFLYNFNSLFLNFVTCLPVYHNLSLCVFYLCLTAKTSIVCILSSVQLLCPPQSNTLNSQQVLAYSHTSQHSTYAVKYICLWTLCLHSIFHINIPNIIQVCILSSVQPRVQHDFHIKQTLNIVCIFWPAVTPLALHISSLMITLSFLT